MNKAEAIQGNIFQECPNEHCYDGTLWHYGKHDAWRRGECPDCGGTGKVVIEDKEKEAMLAFIMEVATTPVILLKPGGVENMLIMKAQAFLKQLPNKYLK